jgi:hypothetical protein
VASPKLFIASHACNSNRCLRDIQFKRFIVPPLVYVRRGR